MTGDFWANREALEDEFRGADWIEGSGESPERLKAGLEAIRAQERPQCVLRGEMMRYVAKNAQIAINPRSVFCGKINAGIAYDEHAKASVYEQVFQEIKADALMARDPELVRRRAEAERIGLGFGVSDYWHAMPDWARILKLGIPGLREAALSARRQKAESGALTQDQADFYESVLLQVDAVMIYGNRLREAGRQYGLSAWADCLDAVLSHAPKTLYEVMQTVLLYLEMLELGVERGRTLGRVDVLYAPYVLADMESGASEEAIRELFRYFFQRFSAARRFAAQPLTIDGTLPDGSDASNFLTTLILDVYEELNVRNPKIQVRLHSGTPEALLRRLLSMIRSGQSAIVLIWDETVYRAYEKLGIPRAESVHYVPFGCYEPMLPGREDAMIGASWTNIAKAVELAMNGGANPGAGEAFVRPCPLDFSSYEDFFRETLAQIGAILAFIRASILAEHPLQMEINPSPLYSASIQTCVERGRDVFGGGMTYENISVKCFGIATLVDSLMAVKRFVFEKKAIGFSAFRDALSANWRGHERLRLEILRDAAKYGNNDSEADACACAIMKYIAGEIVGRDTGYGGKFRLGGDSITHCISCGGRMGATPDGRLAGEPVSKNFCPTAGMERQGVTAYLESVCKYDFSDFADAAVVDLALHRSAVEGEKGLEAMLSLVRYYFDRGGFAIQMNVLDLAELERARSHPREYADLQVRLCGWNEYWVNMEPEKQDAFLKRMRA